MSADGDLAFDPRTRAERLRRLAAIHHAPAEIARRSRTIYRVMLERSENIRTGNFDALGVADLRLLVELCEQSFFDGLIGRMMREDRAGALALRLSDRMTRAAGKTFYLRRPVPAPGGGYTVRVECEIAVSTLLLFQTFSDPGRSVTIGGLPCRDRLEALQRIVEHELLHLAEFLASGRSSCAAEEFQVLSRRIFGHGGVHHDLVTPREHVAATYQIRVGDRVSFEHDGARRFGRVNRITKRATVLVEDAAGVLYSDGRRYATFYVPVPLLRKEPGVG